MTYPDTALPPGAAIGVIGGGQLGRMLAIAAAKLGYRTCILEPQEDCPAAQVANMQIVAPYDDEAALERLSAACDVVTYEFENVPVGAAHTLAGRLGVYPPPRALEIAQDRLVEKTFLNECGIDTAHFIAVDSQAELDSALRQTDGLGVLKTRRLGYDGKGQIVFKGVDGEHPDAFRKLGSTPLILESFVAFDREISIVAARGADGSTAMYDPAENRHEGGILRQSTAPAPISPETAEAAREAAARILDSLDYVGVIGVEFFVLPDGRLLANEIAPRVHNSGHWTEAACAVSQFEQHIRAVCGLPLGDCARHSDCVMENLIGDDVERSFGILEQAGAALHLYGKKDARPGRKMGHVTWLK
ncbi:5-(carboxyamino)imidazole ribonucleotide synthase [Hoeflea sp. CAU 1731]